MKSVRSTEPCADKVDTLRCKKDDADFNICGNSQSCVFTTKLNDSIQWLSRAGDASKRRYLTGVLVRCQSVEILENVKKVLQVTFGKDFTYTRSRQKPSLPEDMITWSSDRALDTKMLGMEMVDTWNWFSRSNHWTKSNYLLRILFLCDTQLLHMLGNLTSVLIAKQKRAFLQYKHLLDNNDPEDDTSSIRESTYSFNSQKDHPDLDLLIQASSFYEPVSVYNFTDVDTTDGGQETCHDAELSNRCRLNAVPRVCLGPRPEDLPGFDSVYIGTVKKDSDIESICSDDPALMVVPRSSHSVSGVSRYRDFIRGLPVHLAKRILGLLDKASLHSCKDVSQHWRYLMEDTQQDLNCKKIVEKQSMLMQSNITTDVSSTYAKVREVLLPVREDEKHMHHGDIFSEIKWERGFAAVYAGVRTRAVRLEERNVYCGVYNILLLLDREDPSRVVHYDGGQLVAVGSKDRIVRLLDVVALKEVFPVIQGHAGSIRALVLCEERGLVISASYDLSIRCWNLKTGTCTMLLRGHLGTINCLDLHEDCLVSGAKDCKVKVWNLQTGKCYEKLKFKHHNPILCVKIDKALVLSSCEKGLVKMWGMETASLLKTINAHHSSVKCLFFDQWHILSGGSDGEVMAWSTSCEMKKSLMTYRHPKEVLTLILQFLRVITGCGDGKIRIFNFLTGDCLRVIRAGGQHSPILSLHTHNHNMVVNTRSSVLLFRFTKVRWDYSVPAERQCCNELQGTPKGALSRNTSPHAQVRAERMALVGSSNCKIYNRKDKDPEKPALSHHARSLSAPSMRRAQAAQQESMRPATWSELQSYRRSRAYIDLQPEFITKPPSAISPWGPVSGHSQESQTRTIHTPSSNTTCTARDTYVTTKWMLTRSEKAVRDRVEKRGPHHNVTTDRVLLSVNSTQRAKARDQAGVNMELNAQLRDVWGSPPSLTPPDQGKDPEPQASPPPPVPKQSPLSKFQKAPSAPSHRAFQCSMTKTYTPLLTRALNLKPRRSLHSREVRSSVPSPVVLRPGTGHAASTQRLPCPERAQTSRGVPGSAVSKVGAFTTSAQSDVQEPGRMFPKTTCKRPGRRVDFVMPNKTISLHNPPDPFRVLGAFRLLTDTQLEDYIRSQTHQHGEGCSATWEDLEKQRKTTWTVKVKGVSTTDHTEQDQVYAPELGQDPYI